MLGIVSMSQIKAAPQVFLGKDADFVIEGIFVIHWPFIYRLLLKKVQGSVIQGSEFRVQGSKV